MRELNWLMGCRDPNIVIDLCTGLPMAGWARHSTTLVQKKSVGFDVADDPAELAKHNAKMVARVGTTGDAKLDEAAWQKSVDEFADGSMLGPFESLDELPVENPRVLPRFPIWERNGGAVEWKVRAIDDCKLGGQNERSGTTSAHRPADLDYWVMLMRVLAANCLVPLMAFTSDFKSAYRQVTSCPNQARMFVLAIWNPVKGKVVYALAVTQMFGSSLAPLNFSRYPQFCAEAMSVSAAI